MRGYRAFSSCWWRPTSVLADEFHLRDMHTCVVGSVSDTHARPKCFYKGSANVLASMCAVLVCRFLYTSTGWWWWREREQGEGGGGEEERGGRGESEGGLGGEARLSRELRRIGCRRGHCTWRFCRWSRCDWTFFRWADTVRASFMIRCFASLTVTVR